jgi:hypothetical protein
VAASVEDSGYTTPKCPGISNYPIMHSLLEDNVPSVGSLSTYFGFFLVTILEKFKLEMVLTTFSDTPSLLDHV